MLGYWAFNVSVYGSLGREEQAYMQAAPWAGEGSQWFSSFLYCMCLFGGGRIFWITHLRARRQRLFQRVAWLPLLRRRSHTVIKRMLADITLSMSFLLLNDSPVNLLRQIFPPRMQESNTYKFPVRPIWRKMLRIRDPFISTSICFRHFASRDIL